MTECCTQSSCRRKQPMMLMKEPLSGSWYVVTRWKPYAGETMRAIEKHELPLQNQVLLDQMRDDSGWLRAVLECLQMDKDQLAEHLGVTVGK